jgi:hypothetical protein
MADTPDWLKPTSDDLAADINVPDVEEGSVMEQSKTNNNNDNDGSSSRGSFSCSFGAATILLISAAFLGVFVYSAVVQVRIFFGHVFQI